jgi:MFS family permease
VADHHAPPSEKQLNVSKAQAEEVIKPDGMPDDLSREAVPRVGGGLGRHRAILARPLRSGQRSLNVTMPSRELGLSPVELGWLFFSFAWAYVLGQVPASWLVDRLGAKRSVLVGLVGWSAVTFLMSGVGWLSAPFLALLLLRFLLGLL